MAHETENKLFESEKDEEEDSGTYFLKPASSPYNLAEKVKQANHDLYNSQLTESKTSKVKFRENQLVTFEPELTDDDVASIESERADDDIGIIPEEIQYLEYKSCEEMTKEMYSIEEEIFDDVEELDSETQLELLHSTNQFFEKLNEMNQNESDETDESSVQVTPKRDVNKQKKHKNKKNPYCSPVKQIDCKIHCIEKIDYNNVPMYIKRLQLKEKPLKFPPLKLYQRKCCSGNKPKENSNLPRYMGLRSEYGLTLKQIENREKSAELIKLRQQRHLEMLEEYKKMRMQENEEVFAQWLRDVAKRKSLMRDKYVRQRLSSSAQTRSSLSSSSKISICNQQNCSLINRPKTASPKNYENKSSRPYTSQPYFFVQIPTNLMQKGINVKAFLGTNRKLHIVSLT